MNNESGTFNNRGQILLIIPQACEIPALTQEHGGGSYCSTGFGAFLEMYGLIGYDVCSTEQLGAALEAHDYPVVLVSHLQDYSPVLANIDQLLNGRAVLLEGPISPAIANRVGICPVELSQHDVTDASVVSEELKEKLTGILEGYNSGSEISLLPIECTVLSQARDADGAVIKQEQSARHPFSDSAPIRNAMQPGPGDILSVAGDPDKVLLTRRGSCLISSFPILDLIARRLGAPRLDSPVRRMTGERNGENLDFLLLLSLADAARECGRPLVTIEPWPIGIDSVVTIRHDFDRPVMDASWNRLLRWEQQENLGVSWYFLSQLLVPDKMAQVVKSGHEIGYHYTDLNRSKEQAPIPLRSLCKDLGCNLEGATCHGGNYRGEGDLEWLGRRDFTYSELLTRCSVYPFRPITLASPEQGATTMDILVAARHLSVDLRVTPEEADFSYGAVTRAFRQRVKGHIVIMNHPDINFEALVEAVGLYRSPRAAYWTQSRTLTWWRDTHLMPWAHISRRALGTGHERISLRHASADQPAVRIWANATAKDSVYDDRFGETHTIVPVEHSSEMDIEVTR